MKKKIPELDGLRAIAVVSVIIYHAKFDFGTGIWLSGGFLGVDIFFVISGYLISRIIFNELHQTGRFSFLNFYERRARRILPMLFVVLFTTVPAAAFMLFPTEFKALAASALSAIAFGSNFYFYFSTI